jgi:hypothetical protein
MHKSPIQFLSIIRKNGIRRGALFGAILLGALLFFEIFNYSTTDFALTDLLGSNLTFLGMRWAAILSIAFCGIDFAGVARLFTPEQGRDEPAEVWYLFGAWILAAAMNALLTWWGVSAALVNNAHLSANVIDRATLIKIVPVFVAVMVWIIRILLIGTFSMAGDRLFSVAADDRPAPRPSARPDLRPASQITPRSAPRPSLARPKPASANSSRPDPTYHPVGLSAKNNDRSEREYR